MSAGRSRNACYRCNQKKIRCQITETVGNVSDAARSASCLACSAAGVQCLPRPGRGGGPSSETGPVIMQTSDARSRISLPYTTHVSATAAQGLGTTGLLDLLISPSNEEDFCQEQYRLSPQHGNDAVASNTLLLSSTWRANLHMYHKNFYVWCPVLDNVLAALPQDALLLGHALSSLIGTIVNTFDSDGSVQHSQYVYARDMIYAEGNTSPLVRLIAAMLIRSNRSGQSDVSGTSSGFWWTGLAIRMAQTLGLHQELPGVDTPQAGLRRRIWWTLYARERVIALCQSRPCVIDDDYNNVSPLSLDDFPQDRHDQGTIFISWVGLSRILGDINKQLFICQRRGTAPSAGRLISNLAEWYATLPAQIRITLRPDVTDYNRDVQLLHIPYLAAVALLHLRISGNTLPIASLTAVVAASCTARIFEDFMARGSLEFMWGEVSWFLAVAILSLLHVIPINSLRPHVEKAIGTLTVALKHLAETRQYARIILAGIERIIAVSLASEDGNLNGRPSTSDLHGNSSPGPGAGSASIHSPDEAHASGGPSDITWEVLMPFANHSAGGLLQAVIEEFALGARLEYDTFPDYLEGLWDNVDHTFGDTFFFPPEMSIT